MQFYEKLHATQATPGRHTLLLIWNQLPLMLLMDVVICLALLPAVATWLFGFPLLAPAVAALTLGPVWAGVSALANRLIDDGPVSWHDFLRAIGDHWRTAIGVSLVPAAMATILMGTWLLQASSHANWLYLPLFVDGCVAVFIALACLSAFSLATSRPLRGWRLWKVSLALTVLQSAKILGTVALFVVLALLLALLNGGFLLQLLLAPFAVCLTALTQQACARLEQREQAA